MQSNKPSFQDYLLISLAILFWGFSLIWSDDILDLNVPVFVFIFMRMVVAGITMLAITVPTGKLQRIRKGDLKYFILLVFFEPFLYFLGETFGLLITDSPTLVAVVIASIPIFTAIVGQVFFHEAMTKLNLAGVVVTLIGVGTMLIAGGSLRSDNYWTGISVLMLSVVGSLCYSFFCRKLTHKYTAVTIVTYQFSFAIPFFLIPFLIWGLPEWKPEYLSLDVISPLLCLALICSCLCFLFYTHSIGKIGVTKSAVFTALIPVVSAITAYFTGKDHLSAIQIASMGISLLGVVMSQYRSAVKNHS